MRQVADKYLIPPSCALYSPPTSRDKNSFTNLQVYVWGIGPWYLWIRIDLLPVRLI